MAATLYLDADTSDQYVLVRNLDTDALVTSLPKASAVVCSSAAFIVTALAGNIPSYTKLYTDISWADCLPLPAAYSDAVEIATALGADFFPCASYTATFTP